MFWDVGLYFHRIRMMSCKRTRRSGGTLVDLVRLPNPHTMILTIGTNDVISLAFARTDDPPVSTTNSTERRRYFRNPHNLQNPSIVFKKDQIYTFEVFAPFIDLNAYDLSLGITLNMKKYSEGQDFRMVLCRAKKDEEGKIEWTKGDMLCAMEFRLKEWGRA